MYRNILATVDGRREVIKLAKQIKGRLRIVQVVEAGIQGTMRVAIRPMPLIRGK